MALFIDVLTAPIAMLPVGAEHVDAVLTGHTPNAETGPAPVLTVLAGDHIRGLQMVMVVHRRSGQRFRRCRLGAARSQLGVRRRHQRSRRIVRRATLGRLGRDLIL
jgi:hypothetical protein